MKWNLEFKTKLLLGLFVASLIAANLIGGKITKLWIIEVSVGYDVDKDGLLGTDEIMVTLATQYAKRNFPGFKGKKM